MDAQNVRRDADDRRELAVYYCYGNERRNFSMPALFVSFLGAAILRAIVNLLRRGTVR